MHLLPGLAYARQPSTGAHHPGMAEKKRGIAKQGLWHGFGDTNTLTSERRLDMISFLAGAVYKTCNNGWMRTLEVTSIALLRRVINDSTAADTRTEIERLMLAKWCVNTSIARTFTTPPDSSIDHRHITNFDQGQSPKIGRCEVFTRRLPPNNSFGDIQATYASDLLIDTPNTAAEIRITLFLDVLMISTAFVDPHLAYTLDILEKTPDRSGQREATKPECHEHPPFSRMKR
jgi:hypothetical protein